MESVSLRLYSDAYPEYKRRDTDSSGTTWSVMINIENTLISLAVL